MPNHRTNLGAGTTAVANVTGGELLGSAIGGVMSNILHSVLNARLEARG